jgi:hypothetical protein
MPISIYCLSFTANFNFCYHDVIVWSVCVTMSSQNEEDKSFFVIEARFPIQIDKAKDVADAARQARTQIEKEFGINISNWFLRGFEYTPESEGPFKEWFCNPGGVVWRELTKNHNRPEHEGLSDGKTG